MRLTLYSVLLWVIVWSGVVHAQESGEPLSLAQAIATALEKNPFLHATQQQVIAATTVERQARAGFLPTVDVEEGFSRSDSPISAFSAKLSQGRFSQNDLALPRLNQPSAISNFHTALSLVQPLYTGGKASLSLKRAQLHHEASLQNYERQQQLVIFQVASHYYGVLLAGKNLAVARAALTTAEANSTTAQDRFATGMVVESDLLSAQVRVATLKEQEIVAGHRQTLALAALNDAMGMPLETQWRIEGPFVSRPSPTEPLPELEEKALHQRPEYRQSHVEEQALEHGVALARTTFLPTVRATARYDINRPHFASGGQDNWFVGVTLHWNLFNGLGDVARVAEARAEVARSRALQAQLASRITLEVKDAFLTVKAAEERISVARQGVTQADTALQIITDRYRAGLTTIVELVSGEAAVTTAHGALAQALHDQSIGVVGLELAVGTLRQDSF